MHSMTGCGKGSASGENTTVNVELRSVNHRFLDVALRLPRTLSFLEAMIRRVLSETLRRGHVDVYVTVDSQTADNSLQVDAARIDWYIQQMRLISENTGVKADISMAELLRLPQVVKENESTFDEEQVTALCEQALREAIRQLKQMREREGENLQRDLTLHLDAVAAMREQVALRAPSIPPEYREKLLQRIAQIAPDGIDEARLAQEVALMADRCAIDEELSRLESHIAQMRRQLAQTGEAGKKMDFLIQEMNRETNTIGSKCQDAETAHLVVDMKSEIEKLREQVQNVE